MLEPIPLVLCDREVELFVLYHAVGEVGGDGQVELVCYGIHVGFFLVPPDSSLAGGGAAVLHVGEDVDCGIKVLCCPRDIVGLDPSQRPPPFVVVIPIQKSFGILLAAGKRGWSVTFGVETLNVVIFGDDFGDAKVVVGCCDYAVGVHGADLALD